MSPDRVLVWTASPAKRTEVHLVALDRATGDEAYTVPFPQPGSFVVTLFAWNGEHLLIGFMSGLWAINPATGETVWKKGATGMGGEFRPSEFRDL
jgi:outer membrane protein assembly factor BamB